MSGNESICPAQCGKAQTEQTLCTRRVMLRPARAQDAESLEVIRNSEFVLEFNAMNRLSRDEVEKMVAQDRDSKGALYMERRTDGRLMGAIYLSEDSMRYGVRAVELSYYLGGAYARQGYMTEALAALIDRIFSEDRAELISARVFADNKASRGLMEKLGFHQDGCLRRAVQGYGGRVHDDCLYSLMQMEWVEKKLCD